jgi:hypothetical protein
MDVREKETDKNSDVTHDRRVSRSLFTVRLFRRWQGQFRAPSGSRAMAMICSYLPLPRLLARGTAAARRRFSLYGCRGPDVTRRPATGPATVVVPARNDGAPSNSRSETAMAMALWQKPSTKPDRVGCLSRSGTIRFDAMRREDPNPTSFCCQKNITPAASSTRRSYVQCSFRTSSSEDGRGAPIDVPLKWFYRAHQDLADDGSFNIILEKC